MRQELTVFWLADSFNRQLLSEDLILENARADQQPAAFPADNSAGSFDELCLKKICRPGSKIVQGQEQSPKANITRLENLVGVILHLTRILFCAAKTICGLFYK